jgi:uncharacterized protein YcaQ
MPIHAGDAIVGRIQMHREKGGVDGAGGALVIDGLWWEKRTKPQHHLEGLTRAIRSHQRLLGLTAGKMPSVLAERRDGGQLFKRLKRADVFRVND